jgi:hypothetical protein
MKKRKTGKLRYKKKRRGTSRRRYTTRKKKGGRINVKRLFLSVWKMIKVS